MSNQQGASALKQKFEREAAKQAPKDPKLPPKTAKPTGSSVGGAKSVFEQKIKEQKPQGKTDFMKGRFERKIETQEKEVQFQKQNKPKETRSANTLVKQFEQGTAGSPSQTKSQQLKKNFEQPNTEETAAETTEEPTEETTETPTE